MGEINTGLHYPIKLNQLPSGWIAAFVGDFCYSIQSGFACGQHSDSDIGIHHLRPMNISREGVLDFKVVKYVASNYDDRRLCVDDVLFNNTNSPELIGKTALITHKGNGLAFSNHMTRLRFHPGVNSKFGAYQLHFLWMGRYFLHGCVKHVNQASISAGELAKSVPFIAPPLAEQHRIVAKIESLFSELDNGIESLKTAREQLKTYRQALLKHAFSGKLTEQWRADRNRDNIPSRDVIPNNETAETLFQRIQSEREQSYQQQLKDWEATGKQGSKPKPPKTLPPLITEGLAELPVGWGWISVAQLLTEELCNGKSVKDRVGGFPVLRLNALVDGKIDLSISKAGEWTEIQAKNYVVKNDDFLVSRGNGSKHLVGRGGSVRFQIGQTNAVAFPDTMIRVRLQKSLVSLPYFAFCWDSSLIRGQIEKTARTTAGIYKINQELIQAYVLPLPNIEEQKVISDLLSEKLSKAEQLNQTLTAALQQAEALRLSILKKAFSGQLVPQDPSDEPASVLLERIQAEKVKSNTLAPGSRGKKTVTKHRSPSC